MATAPSIRSPAEGTAGGCRPEPMTSRPQAHRGGFSRRATITTPPDFVSPRLDASISRSYAPPTDPPTAICSPTPRLQSRKYSLSSRLLRVQLDEALDLEAGGMKKVDPFTVTAEELDAVLEGPGDSVQILLRTQELLGRTARLVGDAEHCQHAVRQEYESSARTEQAGGLGQPARRVAIQARSILGDRQVERRVRQRNVLRARLDERELNAGLRHRPPRRVELCRRDVDAHRPGAPPGEPRREIRSAAPELDDIDTVDLTEDADVVLVNAEDAPRDVPGAPRIASAAVRELRVLLAPTLAVASNVVPGVRQDRIVTTR